MPGKKGDEKTKRRVSFSDMAAQARRYGSVLAGTVRNASSSFDTETEQLKKWQEQARLIVWLLIFQILKENKLYVKVQGKTTEDASKDQKEIYEKFITDVEEFLRDNVTNKNIDANVRRDLTKWRRDFLADFDKFMQALPALSKEKGISIDFGADLLADNGLTKAGEYFNSVLLEQHFKTEVNNFARNILGNKRLVEILNRALSATSELEPEQLAGNPGKSKPKTKS